MLCVVSSAAPSVPYLFLLSLPVMRAISLYCFFYSIEPCKLQVPDTGHQKGMVYVAFRMKSGAPLVFGSSVRDTSTVPRESPYLAPNAKMTAL